MFKKTVTISSIIVLTALLSCLYYIYDIKYPNHFVGDMYGLEVMFRVSIILVVSVLLLIGLLMLTIGWKRKNKRLTKIGLVLADLFSIVLILMSLNVYFSRYQDEIRKRYPQKSTDKLIRIALEKNDQYAIYEIIARKDTSAVPALSGILLDENQNVRLRIESAHALGQIGGYDARASLDKALTISDGNSFLAETIKYSIENIDGKDGR